MQCAYNLCHDCFSNKISLAARAVPCTAAVPLLSCMNLLPYAPNDVFTSTEERGISSARVPPLPTILISVALAEVILVYNMCVALVMHSETKHSCVLKPEEHHAYTHTK
jgi:hypothetical protein